MAMDRINETLKVRPTAGRVTTMTVVGKLNADNATMERIVHKVRKAIDTHGEYDGMTMPEGTSASGFDNQVTVKCGRMSVKLFTNGTIHVTGCKAPIYFMDVVDRMVTTFQNLVENQDVYVVSAKTSLINLTFHACRILPLAILQHVLNEEEGVAASYNVSEYAGLKAEFKTHSGAITSLVFNKGNVMLTGGKSPLDVASVYERLCRAIDRLTISIKPVKPQMKPSGMAAMVESYDIINNYPLHYVALCTGPDVVESDDDDMFADQNEMP